jgi:alkaline phosphatase D
MILGHLMSLFNRRNFLKFSAMGISTVVLSSGLMGCGSDSKVESANEISVTYEHGVASGDPTATSVILWTRVTPTEQGTITISWEVATDEAFQNIVNNGTTTTSIERDYTVKIDTINLAEGNQYYYRFQSANTYSPIGRTKTLPVDDVSKVKLAVMSCANYPAGYFHAYADVATVPDIDAVVHLGDYIYEYGREGYAAEDAASLNREVLPEHETLSLADYRTRYGQYKTDLGLQSLHAHAPFICVWDDHEVANDTWKDGAENHNEDEGDFTERKIAALQAYFEWLPIRPVGNEEFSDVIYRNFQFGNLVNLIMLDTRIVGRDKQLDYANYIDSVTGAFETDNFTTDAFDTNRTLLGLTQLNWLQDQLNTNQATWQVLGQQILMGTMTMPAAIVTQQLSISVFAELGAIATLAARAQASDPTLTVDELAYLQENLDKLTPDNMALLQLPAIPYNLDAWDGYAYERELLFNTIKQQASKLVVLAGDTHNAWANDLKSIDGTQIGVEFATSSVSSPGLESYLGVAADDIVTTEAGLVGLIENLTYLNMSDRGYLLVTFEESKAQAEWVFVSDIKSKEYTLLPRDRKLQVLAEQMYISEIT